MPYKTIQDLPSSVSDNLPEHAQEIYRSAFNNAWDEYGHDKSRAHKVAWGAVKKKYEKDEGSGYWEEKPE